MATNQAHTQARSHLLSLYRSILRELPPRPVSAPSSSLQASIRDHFSRAAQQSSSSSSRSSSASSPSPSPSPDLARRQELDQFVQYLRAKRTYSTLLDRYNPGLVSGEDGEERVRLTARRVGMEMPVEFDVKVPGWGKGGK